MAHYNLGVMYDLGEGVEKDKKREIHHMEEAAIGGHPWARINLGVHAWNRGRYEIAVKHYIIAANLGHTSSMQMLWEHYKLGNIGKEDLEATLRAHQAALVAMKSPQREEAAAAYAAYIG